MNLCAEVKLKTFSVAPSEITQQGIDGTPNGSVKGRSVCEIDDGLTRQIQAEKDLLLSLASQPGPSGLQVIPPPNGGALIHQITRNATISESTSTRSAVGNEKTRSSTRKLGSVKRAAIISEYYADAAPQGTGTNENDSASSAKETATEEKQAIEDSKDATKEADTQEMAAAKKDKENRV